MIYLSLFNAMLYLRYLVTHASKLRTELYYVLYFLLFVFVAFRWEVGCDWSGYLNQFNIQEGLGINGALAMREPLWWGIMEFQHYFDLSYPWLNVISSIIFFIGLHLLARRQPDPLSFLILAFPILIVNMPMTAMRQGAAIGVMCFAFTAFSDKRTAAFVSATVLASLLHSSALVFILLAPLVGGKVSPFRVFLSVVLAIPGVYLLLNTSGADRAISLYVEQEIDSLGAVFRNLSIILTAVMFFLVARKSWRRMSQEDYSLVLVSSFAMIAVAPLLLLSTVIADRFGYYLVPIQCVIFARLPYLPLGKYRTLYSVLPYFGLLTLFTYWTLNSYHFNQCYVPYQTWFFGLPEEFY